MRAEPCGAETRFMMILFDLLVLVLFWMSVRRLRGSREGGWPFAISAALTGLLALLSVGGVLVALAVGRRPWNDWTAGTVHREGVTLSLLLEGFPLLLALALLFFLGGSLSQRLHRLGSTRRSAP